MKHFFKTKFFYIMTVITLIVTIVPTVFFSMGITFPLRNAVCALLTPLQNAFNAATEAVAGFTAYFYKFDELAEENERLRSEVSSLRAQIYDFAEMEDMYAWMSDYLELKMRHTDFKMTAATVTGRESGNYSRVLTLDVGSGAGIKLNMPVVTSDGVVGRITEVGSNWSKVTTITCAGSAVGAYVEKTSEEGVCEGKFDLSKDGLLTLSYLSKDNLPNVGDRVLTTGYGSVYPRGLVVGYVDSVSMNPYSRAPEVYVKCAADFSSLTRVMVITEFTETSQNASQFGK